ncbi:T9SS type A sorting domain-containing protein [Flavobacterium sp.]|uniref:T9SS type A sorting domain-containing protein n=1 Tax=Flavobacterium sp. TaxID=239 RepID=UPI003BCF887F
MKKTLFFCILFSSLGFSQQVLKRITQASTFTTVEFFVLRNGTTIGNVLGSNSFNTSLSSTYGSVKLYDNQYVYEGVITQGDLTTIPTNAVCNGIYLVSSSRADQILGFSNSFNSNTPIGLPVTIETNNYRELALGTYVDLLYTKLQIAKILLPFWDPVPEGTWITVNSREGVDLTTGQIIVPSKRLGFKYTGGTWVLQSTDWLNVSLDDLQDVCDLLSNSTFGSLESTISIVPNPSENYIKIQNKANADANFEYQIIDSTGRIITKGKSTFNENINTEILSNGNYFIKISNENEEVAFKKFIKI